MIKVYKGSVHAVPCANATTGMFIPLNVTLVHQERVSASRDTYKHNPFNDSGYLFRVSYFAI